MRHFALASSKRSPVPCRFPGVTTGCVAVLLASAMALANGAESSVLVTWPAPASPDSVAVRACVAPHETSITSRVVRVSAWSPDSSRIYRMLSHLYRVSVSDNPDSLLCCDPSGEVMWAYEMRHWFGPERFPTLSVGGDLVACIGFPAGGHSRVLSVHDTAGDLLWTHAGDERSPGGPLSCVIDAGGRVIFGIWFNGSDTSADGFRLRVLDAQDGSLLGEGLFPPGDTSLTDHWLYDLGVSSDGVLACVCARQMPLHSPASCVVGVYRADGSLVACHETPQELECCWVGGRRLRLGSDGAATLYQFE